MSKQAVTDMLSRADRDDALMTALNTALESSTAGGEAFVAAAAGLGYDFTPDEFREVIAESSASDVELDEAALGSVAGGLIATNGITLKSNTLDFGYRVESVLTRDSNLVVDRPPMTP